MAYTIIAPVGKRIKNLFTGLKAFPAERVILVTNKKNLPLAEKTKKELEKTSIEARIVDIEGNVWEALFEKISELKEYEDMVLINTSTGDTETQCAATSAAFVNGLKAMAVEGKNSMLLPALKFSYYKMLTDKKLELLKVLGEDDCCQSLDVLAKKTKMSLPLISYHVNGNLKSEGLKELGLVETKEEKGRVAIQLSTLGKLLLKGYIPHE